MRVARAATPGSRERAARPPATPARRWSIGLVMGAVFGFGILVGGTLVGVVGVIALAMLAWERGRSAPIGGVLMGFGSTWVVVFKRAELSCEVDCVAPDVVTWIAFGFALVAIGTVLSLHALRQSRIATPR